MAKNKKNTEKQSQDKQEKLTNSVNSIPGDNQNQNHNSKKEGLGPNTKR